MYATTQGITVVLGNSSLNSTRNPLPSNQIPLDNQLIQQVTFNRGAGGLGKDDGASVLAHIPPTTHTARDHAVDEMVELIKARKSRATRERYLALDPLPE